jgi:hypothetical protein
VAAAATAGAATAITVSAAIAELEAISRVQGPE